MTSNKPNSQTPRFKFSMISRLLEMTTLNLSA